MPTVIQADSLFIDFEVPNYPALDNTWGNWVGTFDIIDLSDDTSTLSGDLTRSTRLGIFELRLKTDNIDWTGIAVGNYKLYIQITNSNIGYSEEKSYKLTIKAEGLV